MSPEDLLAAIAANTLAVDNAVTHLATAERELFDDVKALVFLPLREGEVLEGTPEGRKLENRNRILERCNPRLAILVPLHERLARSMRYTVALMRRLETGWPRRGPDDAARERARGRVRDAVRSRLRDASEEAPERLDRELNERLWDPGILAMLDTGDVEAVIECLTRDLAKIETELAAFIAGPKPAAVLRKHDPDAPVHPRLSRRAARAELPPGPPHGYSPGKPGETAAKWRGSG